MNIASMFLSLGLIAGSSCAVGQQGTSKPTAVPVPPPPAQSSPAPVSPAAAPLQQSAQQPAPAAAAQPVPPPVAANVAPNYILGADDAIHVDVWKEPTLSGPLVVRPDGKISLPLVGDLDAAGKTPMALAADISEKLKQFINDPTVTVTVTGTNSKQVFFLGEVVRQGPIPMTRDMTVLQAISQAGGLTPYANKSHIYILRGIKGNQQKIPFDYKKAVKQGNQQGVVLAAGDTIVVP